MLVHRNGKLAHSYESRDRSTHQSYNQRVTDYDTLVKFVRPLSKTIKRDLDQTVSLARRSSSALLSCTTGNKHLK